MAARSGMRLSRVERLIHTVSFSTTQAPACTRARRPKESKASRAPRDTTPISSKGYDRVKGWPRIGAVAAGARRPDKKMAPVRISRPAPPHPRPPPRVGLGDIRAPRAHSLVILAHIGRKRATVGPGFARVKAISSEHGSRSPVAASHYGLRHTRGYYLCAVERWPGKTRDRSDWPALRTPLPQAADSVPS